ncbi:MAG: class I SAM-dependent methyltransferase [Candidatus Methanofastidiosa archaeon]|jgi:ubiquinone/menaquinone biosynthesis C-methylase UbiE|nr:class I SAM-dependent methyltransferase [Candidatus Methanofastidiosa archaeon]
MTLDDVFGLNIELYEEWFSKNNNIVKSEIEALKQLLPKSGKGIEIGVGTGIFASALGIETGVEPSEKMRNKAIERGINTINAYAENLPIPDNTYDFVLMVTIDCFFTDILQSFKEAYRVLTKEGFLIVAFIDKNTSLGQIYEEKKASNIFYKNARFHSADEMEEILKIAHFEIVDRRQTIFNLENIIQEIKPNVGEGVFAVIKAMKKSTLNKRIEEDK